MNKNFGITKTIVGNTFLEAGKTIEDLTFDQICIRNAETGLSIAPADVATSTAALEIVTLISIEQDGRRVYRDSAIPFKKSQIDSVTYKPYQVGNNTKIRIKGFVLTFDGEFGISIVIRNAYTRDLVTNGYKTKYYEIKTPPTIDSTLTNTAIDPNPYILEMAKDIARDNDVIVKLSTDGTNELNLNVDADMAIIKTFIADNKATNTDTTIANNVVFELILEGKSILKGQSNQNINYFPTRESRLTVSSQRGFVNNIEIIEEAKLKVEQGAGYDLRMAEWETVGYDFNNNVIKRQEFMGLGLDYPGLTADINGNYNITNVRFLNEAVNMGDNTVQSYITLQIALPQADTDNEVLAKGLGA